MDDAGEIAEQRQKNVDPERPTQADLQKHAERRKKDRDENAQQIGHGQRFTLRRLVPNQPGPDREPTFHADLMLLFARSADLFSRIGHHGDLGIELPEQRLCIESVTPRSGLAPRPRWAARLDLTGTAAFNRRLTNIGHVCPLEAPNRCLPDKG